MSKPILLGMISISSLLVPSTVRASTFWALIKPKAAIATLGSAEASNLMDGNPRTAWTLTLPPGKIVRLEFLFAYPEHLKGVKIEGDPVPEALDYLLETSLDGKEYWGCVSGSGPEKEFSGCLFAPMEKKAYADRLRLTIRSSDRIRSHVVRLDEIRIYAED